MSKITPFLWFDGKAEEAMDYYVAAFPNSRVLHAAKGPDGKAFNVSFELAGQAFHALNGGPMFSITPAISFFVNCDSVEELDGLWAQLSKNGMAFMELAAYPFSERFGWVQDQFGVSWQLNLGSRAQKITPFLMYVGAQHGKAEEAVNFYTSLFDNSSSTTVTLHGAGEGATEQAAKQILFTLSGQEFMAFDGGVGHPFTFTEGLSLFVSCETQQEVDKFWNAMTADGGEESRCGWLKDKFGVSWQIIPDALGRFLGDPDQEKSGRAMQAMMQMNKIEIAGLQRAFDGE